MSLNRQLRFYAVKKEFVFTYVPPCVRVHTHVHNSGEKKGSREEEDEEQNAVMLGVETKDGTSATP